MTPCQKVGEKCYIIHFLRRLVVEV